MIILCQGHDRITTALALLGYEQKTRDTISCRHNGVHQILIIFYCIKGIRYYADPGHGPEKMIQIDNRIMLQTYSMIVRILTHDYDFIFPLCQGNKQ